MFDRATWKGIGIGLITSALFYVILRPFLDSVPGAVLRVVGSISQGWVDSIYREAAQPIMRPDGLLLLTLATFFAVGGPVLTRPSFLTASARSAKLFRGFLITNALALSVVFGLMGLIRTTSVTVERCFLSRIAVLAPYLSGRELKDLTARWALVHDQAAFDAINLELRQYALRHNIQPLLKSLEGKPQGRCV